LPSAHALSVAVTIVAVLAIVATFLAAARRDPSQTVVDTMTLTLVNCAADVRPHGSAVFSEAQDGQILHAGDAVRTGADCRVVVTYFEGTSIAIGPSTTSVVGRLSVAAAREPAVASAGAPAERSLAAVDPPDGPAWQRLTHVLSRGVATL